MKLVVLDAATLGFESSAWEPLQRFGELIRYEHTPSDESEIAARIQNADVVFTNKVPLSKAVLEGATQLRFVGVLATGYNVIDVEAARAASVAVCNVPGYGTATTAQHAVSLILELCNQPGLHSKSVHEGDWIRSQHFCYWKQAPIELASSTVGIVGFGAIGRLVAAAMHAMGARIMASARTPRDRPDYPGFEWADNREIFAQADIISLHCPQTAENAGFVNPQLLKTMKPNARLVNTARGGLIDEQALADALISGQLAGAALDVVSEEPMAADCPLLGAPNCIITPHIAWSSEPARHRLLASSVENLEQFPAGKPINLVS
ncbi:MAG: D-2-hydroxyacid dehydrogenase [Coraliomargarita sp.]